MTACSRIAAMIFSWPPQFRQCAMSISNTLRQLGASGGLCLLEEGGRMLLHQAIQRGLLRAVALAVDRGADRRPDRRIGLPANGLHARLPRW